MDRKIIITADGSHSLRVEDLDENYHSVHGALQESKHVFIETGLKKMLSDSTLPLKSTIDILEIGFGTGLNALLTYMEAEQQDVNIRYSSLEAYPIEPEIANQLNYVPLLSNEGNQGLSSIFQQLHTCDWDKEIEISTHFTLHKIKDSIQNVAFKNTYNLIYFDAFGPRVQPEMWTEEVFRKIIEVMNPGGCLVTYCAKGEVKRTLRKVGFTVETLQGPPGKREMTKGTKSLNINE